MINKVKVAVVQHRLLHYRVELFNILKERLEKNGIELHLIHGAPSVVEAKKNDLGQINWSNFVKNRYFRVKGVDLLWQSLPSFSSYELVILIQENRIFSNYSTLITRRLTGKKTAFWGHGKNLQSKSPNGLREKWKTHWLKSVDWWFGYTQSTVNYLTSKDFPTDRITNLNNAIDVRTFKKLCDSILREELASTKSQYGIKDDSTIGVFCGSLYAEKKLALLKDACMIIREKVPNFVLVVIGQGPDSHILSSIPNSEDWLKMLGVQKGRDKAIIFKMAKVMLNPGLVGLHILDSFSGGVPMVTSEDALHSPEFDYLIDGENGLVTGSSVTEYAEGVLRVLTEQSFSQTLSENALRAAELYTVERMADNFCEGIQKCLNR